MCFNCATLQVVHYFLKDENLLRSYNFFNTYYNLYLTFYLNT